MVKIIDADFSHGSHWPAFLLVFAAATYVAKFLLFLVHLEKQLFLEVSLKTVRKSEYKLADVRKVFWHIYERSYAVL
ncbi:hypothetical protein QWY14_10340 [Planococcus sp. N028]|uniref:Transposase n=1 Tax=Planococcus shixiaomingii TaxID=3058393 RepID=A0ABT8N2V9_9BACL|nr:hypothetical protein [Planococcus sp. N028]MDN7242200.1 hypothetical protein [Planococcus sp. N028]